MIYFKSFILFAFILFLLLVLYTNWADNNGLDVKFSEYRWKKNPNLMEVFHYFNQKTIESNFCKDISYFTYTILRQ